MSESVKVTGLQELNRNLARLSDDVQLKYLRGAVGSGARVFKDAAVRNVPATRTGKLRRAIYSKWLKEASGNNRQTFFVSVRRGKFFQSKSRTNKRGKTTMTRDNDAYYWWWIENGHIAAGPGGKLKGGEIRRAKARKALKAAGKFVAARPFMRPAFEANKSNAIEAVRVELAKRIAEGLR